MQLFYHKIWHGLLSAKNQLIDIVIGDTNQQSHGFTANVLNALSGRNNYKNAAASASIEKFDNYNVVERGTNSAGSKMFDVAVYNSDVVTLAKGPVYISQSAAAVTVTDHCGIGIDARKA
jgi:hypothetical protein